VQQGQVAGVLDAEARRFGQGGQVDAVGVAYAVGAAVPRVLVTTLNSPSGQRRSWAAPTAKAALAGARRVEDGVTALALRLLSEG
jgi:hypothetical protein